MQIGGRKEKRKRNKRGRRGEGNESDLIGVGSSRVL